MDFICQVFWGAKPPKSRHRGTLKKNLYWPCWEKQKTQTGGKESSKLNNRNAHASKSCSRVFGVQPSFALGRHGKMTLSHLNASKEILRHSETMQSHTSQVVLVWNDRNKSIGSNRRWPVRRSRCSPRILAGCLVRASESLLKHVHSLAYTEAIGG